MTKQKRIAARLRRMGVTTEPTDASAQDTPAKTSDLQTRVDARLRRMGVIRPDVTPPDAT